MTAGHSTIAALLTPLAPGGIAVVGVAGARLDEILARVLRPPNHTRPSYTGHDQPVFCRLVNGGHILDDAVVVRGRRESWEFAEINIHGGVRIAQQTLALLALHGAEIVTGEDFLTQFGGTNPVELAVDQALLDSPSRRLTQWLLSQRASLSPYLAALNSLPTEDLAAFRQRSRVAIHLLAGMRVALVGPPNAGKSTLANRLIGADRVITSEQPGTTRDWVSEAAIIEGWPVLITDTAGIRDTPCEIEREAIRRSGIRAKEADVVVVVLEAMTTKEERHRQLSAASHMVPHHKTAIAVLNKCDLIAPRDVNSTCQPDARLSGYQKWAIPPATSRSASRSTQLLKDEPLLVSALTGEGLEALESTVASLLGLDLLDDSLPTAFLPSMLKQVGEC